MSEMRMTNRTTPSTPPAGRTKIYCDSADKHLKQVDDTGAVTDLTSGGSGSTVYATVALAEAASGIDNDLMYCVETESYYRYEAAGGAFTDNNTYVLSTNDGGTSRWLAIAGRYIAQDVNLKTDSLYIVDVTDPTKRMNFGCDKITTGTTRTMTLPNIDFTVARAEIVEIRNNTGVQLDLYKIVEAVGDYAADQIPLADVVSSTQDVGIGICVSNIANTTNGYVMQRGRIQIAGFNTTAAAIGDAVYSDAAGNVTLSQTDLIVGQVLTLALNGVIYINFAGALPPSATQSMVTYASIALAEAANGSDNSLCFVAETDTMYRYEASGAAYTDDNTYVLSTGDAGNTRWLGVAGRYVVEDVNRLASKMAIVDDTDRTKKMIFDCSRITSATTRTMYPPDIDFKVAVAELIDVHNSTGAQIDALRVVEVAGDWAADGIALVKYIDSISDTPIGVAVANIANGANGYLMQRGRMTITGLDTTLATVGDAVYSNTSGNLTLTPTNLQIGQVLTLALNGVIYVNIAGVGSGGGSGVTQYTSVALAEGATGIDNDLCYVVETDTFYRYESAASTFTDNNKHVLSTGDAGNTRWLAIAGNYHYSDYAGTARLAAEDIDGTTNAIDTNILLYQLPALRYCEELVVSVVNRNNVTVDIRLAHVDNGGIGALANEDYIYYDVTLQPLETKWITVCAGPADSIMMRSDTTDVTFKAEGKLSQFNHGCKRLGATTVSADTDTAIYTATTEVEDISVIACNKDAVNSAVISVGILDGAIGTWAAEDYNIYQAQLLPNETKIFNLKGRMINTYVVGGVSDDADVNFVCYGKQI